VAIDKLLGCVDGLTVVFAINLDRRLRDVRALINDVNPIVSHAPYSRLQAATKTLSPDVSTCSA